jgi:Protein of unknown function (DUF2587)
VSATSSPETSEPDVSADANVADANEADASEADASEPTVSDVGGLLRIGSMVGSLLDEAHASTMDEAGRRRLADVYARAVDAVKDAVSPELRGELQQLGLPLRDHSSTESELRLAQAQLVGWLNGLLVGVQAAAAGQARFQRAHELSGQVPGSLAGRPAAGYA